MGTHLFRNPNVTQGFRAWARLVRALRRWSIEALGGTLQAFRCCVPSRGATLNCGTHTNLRWVSLARVRNCANAKFGNASRRLDGANNHLRWSVPSRPAHCTALLPSFHLLPCTTTVPARANPMPTQNAGLATRNSATKISTITAASLA